MMLSISFLLRFTKSSNTWGRVITTAVGTRKQLVFHACSPFERVTPSARGQETVAAMVDHLTSPHSGQEA